MLCGGVYCQSLQASLSPKLASGKLLIIPTEEKQTDPDENVMAEYGGIDALLFLITAACFLLWLERLMLRIWPCFQSVGLGYFLSLLSLVSALF